MFKLKTNIIVPLLASLFTLTLAFFIWAGESKEKTPDEKCIADQLQEKLDTITNELESVRLNFKTANERIKMLEDNLATSEDKVADLQQQNMNFQEERDIAHQDVDFMRAEMQRCAGDRAHLDDVAVRYQTSQAHLNEYQQRLSDTEITLAAITRERNNLKERYDWIKKRLEEALQKEKKNQSTDANRDVPFYR